MLNHKDTASLINSLTVGEYQGNLNLGNGLGSAGELEYISRLSLANEQAIRPPYPWRYRSEWGFNLSHIPTPDFSPKRKSKFNALP